MLAWVLNTPLLLKSLEAFYYFKGNAQFVQKVTFEPLLDFKQNHYRSWKYYKSCYTFTSFLHLSY